MKHIIAFVFYGIFATAAQSQQLVLPGDFPDPSVIKIGDTYWASATTSNWMPAFPLLKSKDLVNWSTAGHVFDTLPEWADFYFWAPEISYDKGKVYVYYAAHKKNGNLCVAVASADKPEGPYKDHGPLICEEDGSIDAFPMRNSNGKLYLIWKEDGNSMRRPTPIWASEMNEERTALIGEKKELFRNDQPWEANLVEGVSMMRHGDYIYTFYAAAGCCGSGCTYTSGIARAKDVLGPWEKYNKNPVLTNNKNWICPGHGTPVEKNGRYYFLYHAYNKLSNVYTGREGLLQEFRFTADGWIEFIGSETAGTDSGKKPYTDDFSGTALSADWQWSVFQKPDVRMENGKLTLASLPAPSGAFVARKAVYMDYRATALIPAKQPAEAGIAAIGNDNNTVSAVYENNKILIRLLKEGDLSLLYEKPVKAGDKLYLRMEVRHGKDIHFGYSLDGKRFLPLHEKPIDGLFLPPWDRAVRVGLISKGERGRQVQFDQFSLSPLTTR